VNDTALVSVILGLLGVFGGGTIVALLKLPRGTAVVALTEKAYVIQAGVIDQLQEQVDRQEVELKQVRDQLREYQAAAWKVMRLEGRIEAYEAENGALTRERDKLRARVKHLEDEVKELRKDFSNGNGNPT
jgi:cell division protein FtsB